VNVSAKETEPTAQPETGKTLELTVKDRLLLGEFFPERGSLIDQWTAKDIASKIEIGLAERKEIGLRVDDNRWIWDEKKSKVLNVALGQVEVQFLKDLVDRINRASVQGQSGFTQETAEVAKKIKAL
jgi:hypothetical protein